MFQTLPDFVDGLIAEVDELRTRALAHDCMYHAIAADCLKERLQWGPVQFGDLSRLAEVCESAFGIRVWLDWAVQHGAINPAGRRGQHHAPQKSLDTGNQGKP